MFIVTAFEAVVRLAHTAVETLTTLLTPFTGSFAAALAIVACTVAVRLLISPLTLLQVRGDRRRAALAPQIASLRDKHGEDPVTFATETMTLYRENGASPLRGMLPALAQAPFFMIMYRMAVTDPAGALLGIPLTAHLLTGWPAFLVLLALTAALAWWSSRRMRRTLDQHRLLALMPFLTLFAVAYLPLAGAIYLVTSTAWTALETALWRRPAAVAA